MFCERFVNNCLFTAVPKHRDGCFWFFGVYKYLGLDYLFSKENHFRKRHDRTRRLDALDALPPKTLLTEAHFELQETPPSESISKRRAL